MSAASTSHTTAHASPSNVLRFPNSPSDSYSGWCLSYYETHHTRGDDGPVDGRVLRAETVRELLESYTSPRWLPEDQWTLPASSKTIKDQSPCVTAALMAPGQGRTHAAAGLSRVLFIDFDKSADGSSGLTDEELDSLYDSLCGLRKAFAIHTTTGTQWLPAGRVKLRAVFPLLEPVDVAGYQRLWSVVCSHVQRYAGLETLQADTTKRHPGDLFYLPVWSRNEPHFSRWYATAVLRDHTDGASVDELLWDMPVGEAAPWNTSDDDAPYSRVKYAAEKNDALFRAAFRVGAMFAERAGESAGSASSCEAELTEREISERVWPRFKAALEENTAVAAGTSEPVKDWAAAERTVRKSFENGVAAALEKRTAAVSATAVELVTELRALALGDARNLEQLTEIGGKKCGPLAQIVARGASLLHLLDAVERTALSERVVRAIEVNHNAAARKRLQEAWQLGLQTPVDPAKEHAARQLQVSAEAMGLVCEGKSGRPTSSSGNATLVFRHDTQLGGLFARNARAESDEYVVQRNAAGLEKHTVLSAAELEGGRGYSWCKQYFEQQHGMYDLELEHYQKALRGWLSAGGVQSEYDPLREYLESCLSKSENPGGACGREHLETFFVRHGAAADNALTRAITLSLFKSAVKYVYEPGAHIDSMWVLFGAQGVGKSKVLQALCPSEKYAGSISPAEISGHGGRGDAGRKAYRTASRCWFVEIPEIQLYGNSSEMWKEFISDTRPVVRLSYKQYEQPLLRRGVLVATSNDPEILRDHTGNRRYLPITLNEMIDLQSVARERAGLWAQALREYRDDANTGVPSELWASLAELQEAHREVDAVEETIRDITSGAMPWPEIVPLEGLDTTWALSMNQLAPKAVSLWQWQEVTRARSTNHLIRSLRKAGWVSVNSRAFYTDKKRARLWVHPAFVNKAQSFVDKA